MKILIINGPNLNLLGKREPEIYGTKTFKEYLIELQSEFPEHQIDCYQTNHEGSIIDKLQEADGVYDGVILNPAAYTHTSIAIADAVKAITVPVVEVHISDIEEREAYRKHSYITEVANHIIIGKGLIGYELSVIFLINN